jgi:hypothetical protein
MICPSDRKIFYLTFKQNVDHFTTRNKSVLICLNFILDNANYDTFYKTQYTQCKCCTPGTECDWLAITKSFRIM